MSQRPLSAINENEGEVYFDAKSFHPSIPSARPDEESVSVHFNPYDYGSLRRMPTNAYEYSSLKRVPRPLSRSIDVPRRKKWTILERHEWS